MSQQTGAPAESSPLRPSAGAYDGAFCLECGYDLRGIQSDRCPECGWKIDPAELGRPTIAWGQSRYGRVHAFLHTVAQMSLRASRATRQAIAVRIPLTTAQTRSFEWVVLAVAALSCVLGMFAWRFLLAPDGALESLLNRALVWFGAGGFGTTTASVPFAAGLILSTGSLVLTLLGLVATWPMMAHACRWFYLLPTASDHQVDRALALGRLASAPLLLAPLSAALLLALLYGLPEVIETAAVPLLLLTPLPFLWWLGNHLIVVRVGLGASAMRVAATALLLPTAWIVIALGVQFLLHAISTLVVLVVVTVRW